ncbi:DUF4363 family protein [Clostridium fermenticellae]|uniref:DUF4363 family protein n=1 Tax=Clostridium fermenticellae TaxID=2068654 RepID=A0A386H6S8_9CLOT|nr:DUF4363 family protein [Clostridium fermenticellae]AYD41250.1 DUF4363 family protein [Clostridium fermenticellae]
MRNVIISFSIFVCIIAISVFSVIHINKICNNFEYLNTIIENQIDHNSFDTAYKTSIHFLNDWNKHSSILYMFTNHAEIDNIDNEVSKLTQYIKCKNKSEALASTHTIKVFLENISDNEKINIQNIF